MNNEERIIKLLSDIFKNTYHDCVLKGVAGYLVDNGVITLPVQVGDIVYGQFINYGKEIHECKVTKSKLCQFKDKTIRYFVDVEFDIIDPFYNDGRLTRCGCQAVYGNDFGDWYRVYLTKEEAEKNIKGK